MREEITKGASAPEVLKFDEDKLWRLVVNRASVPEDAKTVMFVDYARSSNPKSDESSLAIARVFTDGGATCYYILDVISDRWTILELPYQIVVAAKKFCPKTISIERLSNWELLGAEITRQAQVRCIDLGRLHFFKADKTPMAKAIRMRKLYKLCESGGIRFVSGAHLNKLFSQMCRFDFESKNNFGRLDDACDAVSLLVSH